MVVLAVDTVPQAANVKRLAAPTMLAIMKLRLSTIFSLKDKKRSGSTATVI
jgi:hypothetical protein